MDLQPAPDVADRFAERVQMTDGEQPPRPAADVHGLTADVVVCAYTLARWDLLCRAVDSVQAQTIQPHKIIVCIDHNNELAERCRARWPEGGQTAKPFVHVLDNRYEGRLGSARNTAVEQACADIVAFLDDDAAAERTWLERLLDVYAETDAMAVGGSPIPDFAVARPGWFPGEFDWVFGCHHAGLPDERRSVPRLIGASMSVRNAAIRQVGGFHSDNHDDMDMCHRVGAAFGAQSVVYEPRARVRHHVTAERVTWGYFWRRCFHVNRGKVRAFADMPASGSLSADRDFAWLALRSTARNLVAGLRGERPGLARAAATLAGIGLAGLGHLSGRAQLRLGRMQASATKGLDA